MSQAANNPESELLKAEHIAFLPNHAANNMLALSIICPCCHKEAISTISRESMERSSVLCPNCGKLFACPPPAMASAIKNGILSLCNEHANLSDAAAKDQLFKHLISIFQLLNKYWQVKLVKLRADRIGHYIGDTLGYISTLNYLDNIEKYIFFGFENAKCCSEAARGFLQKYITIHPLIGEIHEYMQKNEELKVMTEDISLKATFVNDYGHAYAQKPLKIEFCNAERDLATSELKKIGIEPGKTFVCFLGRDSRFLKETRLASFKHHICRDMDIRTFLPTMRWFASQGIYCLRTGHCVETPIEEKNPFIIDCSQHDLARILDIYLPASCALNISVASGPVEMSHLARVPSLIVNLIHYHIHTLHCLPYVHILYKKFYSTTENRYLSLEEVASKRLDVQREMPEWEKMGIAIENNSSEDILEAAKETWSRINGDFPITPGDKNLDAEIQQKYRSITSKYPGMRNRLLPTVKQNITSFICMSDMRKNPYFLA